MEVLTLYIYRLFGKFLFKKVDTVGQIHQGPVVLCVNHHMGFADSAVAMNSSRELLRQVFAAIVSCLSSH